MSKTNRVNYPLLSKINSPHDVRRLSISQLSVLATEIRMFLVETLDVSGGHFASSLGALELTIALHYVYGTPNDRLVWDVGHQTYVHKILTGRADELITIKKSGGLSGFPKRSESQYDSFGVGHSSTSIGAALGMAEANKLKGVNYKSVAVIGDGALTAGMAFEALNHAGGMHADILVVLNDNEMSISENVGALTAHLTKLLSGSAYNNFRETGKRILKKLPGAFEIAKRIETQAKGMFVPANLFEALNFYYVGPINGHDIDGLVEALKTLKHHQGPKLLHVLTQKGKGYDKAEEDPIAFHHVNPKFNSQQKVEQSAKVATKPTYSNIFGNWICDMAAKSGQLVGITPAMREGSDLVRFSKEYPNRYYDVAIAEQHAITFAAGLACEGFKPVVAIYSTFLQRAYDQVIHDVSIQNLDVLYAVDRAGLVGPDGATHAGSFDLSFMRCIPNTVIMTPSDENECYHMLSLGYEHKGPAMVRYPRGAVVGKGITPELDLKLGQAKLLRQGQVVAILNFGTLLPIALEVAEVVNATVIDMRFVKPIDEKMIEQLASQHSLLLTLEENVVMGGAGSAVNEYLVTHDLMTNLKVRNIGLPDYYQNHGDKKELLAEVGISAAKIIELIMEVKQS
ncbi:1-deoxy-D-xylulose-5-phosphate synthase [Fastidiosibacter lacustris]|uniref:1-deoxy-D-xylulose-5-phosphate synthase n=1 Tax=Fastidiosibacter lacustris TaxID=2056695 RepID=UPI000E344E13|nr:1-deoxy-D-xylulose-5-phosphate synthase [Fastidiosibacter lacustris]